MQNRKRNPGNRNLASSGVLKKVIIPLIICIIAIVIYRSYYKSSGYLYIDSAPAGAEVRIDGEDAETKTPCLIGPIKSGKHAISLHFTGYETWRTEIKTPRKDTLWLTPELLVKSGTFSTLNILSTPTDAVIFIDGEKQESTTPTLLKNLSPGKHTIKLNKSGYIPVDTLVQLLPGVKELIVKLENARGNLAINSTPSNAMIRLNGELLSSKTPYQINDIHAGIHQVEISQNGYKRMHRTVNVSADETISLDVRLDKAKASKQTQKGKLLITAAIVTENDRERATFPALFIGGEVQGQAPCTLHLAEGEYEIEAKLTGFPVQKKAIKIRAGQSLNYKFEFRKYGATN